MIPGHVTVSEAAQSFGVSRQRMHVLLRDYDIELNFLNPRMALIKKKDLQKIPKTREPGRHKKVS